MFKITVGRVSTLVPFRRVDAAPMTRCFLLRRWFRVYLILLLFLPALVSRFGLLVPAGAQGAKRTSEYDAVENKEKDQPFARDQWMMKGRVAPSGQTAAALRLKAHQYKMRLRAATAMAPTGNYMLRQPAAAVLELHNLRGRTS